MKPNDDISWHVKYAIVIGLKSVYNCKLGVNGDGKFG